MDRTVRAWRAGTWEALGVFPAAGGHPHGAGEGYSPVHAWSLLAAGGRVAAGSRGGSRYDGSGSHGPPVTVLRVRSAGAAGAGTAWRERAEQRRGGLGARAARPRPGLSWRRSVGVTDLVDLEPGPNTGRAE